jgi:peptidoglycan/xylan/chitin deacetylase (PgdA/CDA1 family)
MRPGSVSRRVRPFLRTVRMAFRSRAVILLYHRVAAPPVDPLLLCTSPAHFAEHLAVIQKGYTPLTLVDLSAAHAAGRIPNRAVVITFDDGYADNLHTAAPLLRRAGQRATVFVAGACWEGKPFFYDELEEILLLAPRLPKRLRIKINGAAHEWDLEDWARRPKTPDASYWGWNMESAADPTPRHRCFRELFGLLRGASPATRSRTISALRRTAAIGVAKPGARRLMTLEEIRRAAKEGTLELGAHTHSHPALNRMAPEDQREEILSGKRMLESAAGVPMRAFAYPYGSPWDASLTTVRLVREAGFSTACANTPAPVDSESDLFWLPRCLVRDWDGAEFARRLRTFFLPRADIPPQG